MKKLKKGTKPKRLTLGQIWKLHNFLEGEESAESIVEIMNMAYPNTNRLGMSPMDVYDKYLESVETYRPFVEAVGAMTNASD